MLTALFLSSSCAPSRGAKPASLPGTWKTTVTKEEPVWVVPDFLPQYQCDNAGTFVWQWKPDGTFTIDQTPPEGCPAPTNTHIDSTWTSDGNVVRFAKGTPDEESYE